MVQEVMEVVDTIGYKYNGEEVSPSRIAAEWQGANSKIYYNVDVYTDRLLPKGERKEITIFNRIKVKL